MDTDKINQAVLRLGSELRLERTIRQHQIENDKLLWECHKTEQEYVKSLEQFADMLRSSEKGLKASAFQEQLKDARKQLDGNQVNLEVVQKLVHQLEGRNRHFHINVDQLQNSLVFTDIATKTREMQTHPPDVATDNVCQEIDTLTKHTQDLQTQIQNLQETIDCTSKLSLETTSHLVHDAIRK